MGNEFRRFHAIELAPKQDPSPCADRAAKCLVDHYRAAGDDIVLLGELENADVLHYHVHDTWTGARDFDGMLRISGLTTSALEREIGDIVRPIVQRGGLVDQKPAAAPAPSPFAKPSAARLSKEALLLLAAALFMFVAGPMLLGLVLVGPRELSLRKTPASWKWAGLLLGVLASVAIADAFVDLPAFALKSVAKVPPAALVVLPVVAGVLWGTFVLSVSAGLLSPVRGLERIRHDALWPLLRAWMVLVLLRAGALTFVYGPPIVLTLRGCAELHLPAQATWAFVVPAAGLLAHFVWLSLIDNLAVYLDVALATGLPTDKNPWHGTMKRYFRGYVRRGVVDIDPSFLEKALFLPGVRPSVLSYGGGFAHPRVVVGEKPLEAALGELPDEEELPDQTVNAEELPVGIVFPTGEPDDDAALERAERLRTTLGRTPPKKRAYMPRILGEAATLLGWVAPRARDEGLPLISETEEDFGVVKRLLSEHYAAFMGGDDDEVDDTDPSQRDFLFGALLREAGVVARRDVYFSTLAWSLEVASIRAPLRALGQLVRLPLSFYERFLSIPAAKVADAYAALNTGLYPLVQYLCFLRGTHEALLTARADLPHLIETSRVMLTRLEREPPLPSEKDAFRATPRDRAIWLTHVFQGRLVKGRVFWGRVAGATLAALLVGAFAVRSVAEAIAYHPTYERRMKAQAAKSTQGETAP